MKRLSALRVSAINRTKKRCPYETAQTSKLTENKHHSPPHWAKGGKRAGISIYLPLPEKKIKNPLTLTLAVCCFFFPFKTWTLQPGKHDKDLRIPWCPTAGDVGPIKLVYRPHGQINQGKNISKKNLLIHKEKYSEYSD